MKQSTIKHTFLSSIKGLVFISILTCLNACSVKDVLKDPQGRNKSFILFNPNFLTTNYQLRLFDTTNTFIDKSMTIEIFSNKKIVDEEGYYKTSFKTTNGLLNFSVDPNEVITATDPIKFYIKVTSDDDTYLPGIINRYTGSSAFGRVFKLVMKQNNSTSAIASTKASASVNAINKITNSGSSNNSYELFTAGGIEIPIMTDFSKSGFIPFGGGKNATYYSVNEEFSSNLSKSTIYFVSPNKLSIDLPLKLTYRNLLDLNTMKYDYEVVYTDINNVINVLNVSSTGRNYFTYMGAKEWIVENLPFNPNWNGTVVLRPEISLSYINITSVRSNTELKNCPDGFNFKFNNIAAGTTPELEYITYRNDAPSGKLFVTNAGIAKVNELNPTYNTGELFYSNIKNKIVFKDNSQYNIIPNTLEITGSNACGSTTDIKIIPKENLTKYKIAIESQCTGESFSITPSSNLAIRKKGTKDWEGLTIANGIGLAYLENNQVYEVFGNFGSSKINFEFTNDPNSFEAQKQSSLNKNKDLADVNYKLSSESSTVKLLNIKLFYLQSACPFK